MAPSILASSRSLVAENPTLSSKPPVQTSSTTGPSPSTIRAPVLPRSIRSRPSRSGVPGASAARAAQRRSSRPLSVGDTEPPEVAGHGQCIHAGRDVPVARPAGSGSLGRLARLSGLTWLGGSADLAGWFPWLGGSADLAGWFRWLGGSADLAGWFRWLGGSAD